MPRSVNFMLVPALLCGAAEPSFSQKDCKYTISLLAVSPESAAKSAYDSGDRRYYYYVTGGALAAPGVLLNLKSLVRKINIKKEFKKLASTSDVIESEDCFRLTIIVPTYAEKYNTTIGILKKARQGT